MMVWRCGGVVEVWGLSTTIPKASIVQPMCVNSPPNGRRPVDPANSIAIASLRGLRYALSRGCFVLYTIVPAFHPDATDPDSPRYPPAALTPIVSAIRPDSADANSSHYPPRCYRSQPNLIVFDPGSRPDSTDPNSHPLPTR